MIFALSDVSLVLCESTVLCPFFFEEGISDLAACTDLFVDQTQPRLMEEDICRNS